MTRLRGKNCWTVLVTAAGLAAGCTKTAEPVAAPAKQADAPPRTQVPVAQRGQSSLTGTISHGGVPLVAGRLFFFSDTGLVPTVGSIAANGTFKVEGLPEGELGVCVLLDPTGPLPFPEPPAGPTRPVPGGPTGGGPPNRPPMGGPPNRPPMGGPQRPPMGPGGPGGPGPGGMPGGPPGSESSLVAAVPPTVLAQIRNYTVPEPKKDEYTKLHATYGKLGPGNKLKCVVKAGANTQDLELP